MLYAVDLYRQYGHTGKRGEQHTTKAIAQGSTKSSVQRLRDKSSVGTVGLEFIGDNLRLYDFYHL